MAINIDKLLKKKGWTGQELGIIELTSMIHAFQQALEGNPNPQPLVSSSDFRKMLNTLDDPAEGATYNGYIEIHEWLAKEYPTATAQQQQAQLMLTELGNYLTNARTAEDVFLYVEKLPVIMTQKQYNDLVEKRTQEILHPDGEEAGFTIFHLVREAISFYIKQLHTNPRKKNPLKPLKKKLEADLVTDPRILTRYNEVTGNGYYTLPDGTRSDKVSSEEWNKKLAPEVKEALEDEDHTKRDRMSLERNLTIARDIYNGKTEEEANHDLTESDTEKGLFQKTEWHYYEEPPKDLNKWEILESDNLEDYYTSLESVKPDGGELSLEEYDKAITEDAKAFKKEFPTVVTAILKDMEHYIKDVSSIPVEEWVEHTYTFEELYKKDVYGFRETYVDDTAIFDGNWRAIANGIAILRPSDLLSKSTRIDKRGYYQPPEIRSTLTDISLEGFFTDSENYAINVSRIEEDRQVLLSSILWLNGYNTALELIRKHYKLDAVEVMEIPTDSLNERTEALNDFVAMLYKRIKQTDYEDKELQEKKLEVLKDVFIPIDLKETEIPQQKISVAKAWLKDFKAFKNNENDLCNLLCFKREGE